MFIFDKERSCRVKLIITILVFRFLNNNHELRRGALVNAYCKSCYCMNNEFKSTCLIHILSINLFFLDLKKKKNVISHCYLLFRNNINIII